MAQFDHEKLDVYQLEVDFVAWATDLMVEVKKASSVSVREPCDHLDRASLSIMFNTAEGNGKRQMRGAQSSLTMLAGRPPSAPPVSMRW